MNSEQEGRSLDEPYDYSMDVPKSATTGSGFGHHKLSPFGFDKFAFAVTSIVLLCIVAIGGLTFLVTSITSHNSSKSNSANKPVDNFPVSTLSTSDLRSSANSKLQVGQIDQLQVNGQLQVSKSLTLTPTTAPDAATPGQIYYDRTTNTPYYYNGTKFVALTTPTTSIGGISGPLSLGGGLSLINSVINNTGVISIQGQTGAVNFSSGNGIAINGSTITNTGILGFNANPSQVNVTNTNGTVNISIVGIQDGGVLVGTTNNGIASVLPTGPGQCFISDPVTSAPEFGSCSGAAAVTSINGLTNALTIQGSNGITVGSSGSTITINGGSFASYSGGQQNGHVAYVDGSGNIATNDLISQSGGLQVSGAGYYLDLATAGTSTLTVKNSNGSNVANLTVTGVVQSNGGIKDGSGNLYSFATTPTGSSREICYVDNTLSSNCPTGGNVSRNGSTNNNRIAKFDNSGNIQNSNVTDTGSALQFSSSYDIDLLNSGANTTLQIINSDGTRKANLSVEGTISTTTGFLQNTDLYTLPTNGGNGGELCYVYSGSSNCPTGGNVSWASTPTNGNLTYRDSSGNLQTSDLAFSAGQLQSTLTGYTIDLANASNSTLTVTNSLAGTASLSVEGIVTASGGLVAHTLTDNTASGTGNELAITSTNNNIIFSINGGADTFSFPTGGGTGQTICTSGISCASGGGQAVILEPGTGSGTAQSSSANRPSIWINRTGGTGNIVQLQASATDVFVVDSAGNASFRNTLTLGKANAATGQLAFKGSATSNTVSLTVANNTAGYSLTLPTAAPSGNACIGTNASGQLGYVACVTGSGSSGSNGVTGITTGGTSEDGQITLHSSDSSVTITGDNAHDIDLKVTSGSGVSTIGAIDTQTKSSNGAVISGSSLYLQTADGSAPGLVSTAAQTFAGDKTFSNNVIVQGGSMTLGNGATQGSLVLVSASSGSSVTIKSNNQTAVRALTIPTIAADDEICLKTKANCASTGSNFIVNGTSQQTSANFNIQAGAASVAAKIQGASGQDIIDFYTSSNGATPVAKIDSAGALTVVGVNSGSGLIQGTGGLTVSSTITFSSLGAGILHSSSGGVVSSSAVALGTDTSGNYVAGLGTLTGLSASATSGVGITPNLSVAYGSGANQAVQGNTTLTCTSGTNNLSGGGGSVTLGAAGNSCGSLDLVANPTITGALTVQGSGGITVGTSSVAGKLVVNDGGTYTATLQSASLSHNITVNIPYTTGTSTNYTDDICLKALANCTSGSGGSSNFINNSTSLQSPANFHIQSAATGSVTAVLTAKTSQSANLLELRGSNDTAVVASWSVAGLLTTTGLTSSGADTTINDNSNFNTKINTGTSTGTVTIGNNAASTVALDSGSAINIGGSSAAANAITIGGTGTTGILTVGQSTQDNTINIGNATIATGKTGTINLGTSATGTGKTVTTIGNTNGASAISLLVGTGNFSLDGAATSTYALGASTTSGTITLGGTAQTGTLTVGQSTQDNTINIGNATIATGKTGTINIGTSATGTGKTVTTIGSTNGASALTLQGGTGGLSITTQGTGTLGIGNNAVAQTIAIGNTTGATSLSLQVGTGNFSLDGAATSTYALGASTTSGTFTLGGASQTGTITLGQSTQDNTINVGNATIATGKTGTINIGTSATGTGKTVTTIGSTNGASAINLQGGSGGVNVLSGTLTLGSASTAGALAVYNGSNAISLQAGPSTTSYTLYLPTAAGTANQCLTAGGSGNENKLQFQSCGGSSYQNGGNNFNGNATLGLLSGGANTNGYSLSVFGGIGTGTDKTGGDLVLQGGQGTGAGNGGSINFQIAKPGSTGSSANNLATVASLSGTNGAALFKNSANSTTAFQIQNAAGASLLTADTSSYGLTVGGGNLTASFAAGASSTASAALGAAYGDFNGDGRMDAIVTNYNTPSVSVFTNTGTGLPGSANYTLTVGNLARSVVTADFNGDGKTDAAVTSLTAGLVYVYINTGTALPGTATYTLTASSSVFGIAAGDFNGDGRMDLIETNGSLHTAYVYLNSNGVLAATASTTLTVASESLFGVATADFNNDGYSDAVLVGNGLNNAYVFLSNGTTLPTSATTTIAVGSAPYKVATGDFNGDGRPDALVTNSTAGTASLLTNSGSTLAAGSTLTAGSAPYGVASGDFNGDGKTDAVVTNSGGTSAQVYINTGTTLPLTSSVTLTTALAPYDTVVADFTNDGMPDVLTANYSGGNVYMFANTSTQPYLQVSAASRISSNSSTALQVQNTSGSNLLTANTGNMTLTVSGKLIATADTQFKTNSATAFQIQNASGTSLLTGDTTNMTLTVGNSVAPANIAAKVDYTTGTTPSGVAYGDFNGDGKMDLAVSDFGAAAVSVFLNSGSGAYAAKADYTTGTAPTGVAAADFNGDGKPDIVAANQTSNTISVLINNGAGTFAAKVDYATGTTPIGVTTGDFNGDGRADIAVANNSSSSNTVSVFINNGTGTFAAKVDYTAGTNPYGVTAADFNGDGKPDLVASDFNSNALSVFINNGNGTFAAKVDYTTGSNPSYVAAADFNGDGRPDLATANQSSTSVSVFLNNGSGTFAAKADYTVGSAPVGVTASDLNGDGTPDLAVTNSSSATVSTLMNNGAGTFATKVDYTTGTTPMGVTSADLDNNGKPDLAVVSQGITKLSIMLNSASSLTVNGFTTAGSLSLTSGSQLFSRGSVLLQNANNSTSAFQVQTAAGTNLLTGDTSNYTLTVGTAYSLGSSTLFNAKSDISTAINNPYDVATGDFNGDGKTDALVSNYSLAGTSASQFLNSGTALPSSPNNNLTTSAGPRGIATADFNGDGYTDAAVSGLIGGTTGVYLGSSSGLGTSASYTISAAYNELIAGDFNGDGKPDVVMFNNVFNAAYVYLNTGTALSTTVSSTLTTAGTSAPHGATGDFNGDGKIDLAVATNSGVSVFINSGAGLPTSATSTLASGTGYTWVVAGDFTGDGKTDLVAITGNTVSVFNNSGTALSTSVSATLTGLTAPTSMVASDFNGDGKLDLAATNYNAAAGTTVSIFLNSGSALSTTATTTVTTGTGPRDVVAADFNGDSRPDLITANSGVQTASVFINNFQVLNVTGATTVGSLNSLVVQGASTLQGATTFQNNVKLYNPNGNSTTAFQIQNSGGFNLLTADTINMRISVGSRGTATGQLYIAGSMPYGALASSGGAASSYGLAVQGRYLYSTPSQATNGLQIYDISNPASPSKIKDFNTTGTSYKRVKVQGKYAYIDGYNGSNGTLQIVDISNPLSPSTVGSATYTSTNNVPSLYVQGRYAYVGDSGTATLYVFDVSNPASPTQAGSVSLSTAGPVDLYAQGRYVYIANSSSTNRFQIVDVADPANPTLLSGALTNTTIAATPQSVFVQGVYAYVGTSSGSVYVINVSSPTSLSATSVSLGGGSGSAVYAQGHTLYAADVAGVIRSIDITVPSSASLISGTATAQTPLNMVVAGRYAYTTNNSGTTNTVQVFDMGGTYSQQVESGGTETDTLSVRSNANFASDLAIQGALGVGSGLQVAGNSGFSGAVAIQATNTSAFQVADGSSAITFKVNTSTQATTVANALTTGTALAVSSSSTSNTSAVMTVTTANTTSGSALSINGDSLTTGNAVSVSANGLTTGNALTVSANSLTSGNALSVSSTSANATGILLKGTITTTSTSAGGQSETGLSLSRSNTVNITATTPITLSGSAVATTSTSVSFTVANNANRMLLVMTESCSTTPTYNGVSMTQVSGASVVGSSGCMYYMVAPPVGTFTVANLTQNGGGTNSGAVISSWYNVNQSTPIDSGVGNLGIGGTVTNSATASINDVMVGLSYETGNFPPDGVTATSGQTTLASGNNVSSYSYSSGYKSGVGGSTSMSWSSSSVIYATAAVIHQSAVPGLSVSGTLASLSSNCTVTAGACADSSNILSLNQQYASATGAVLALQNSGTGADILLGSSTTGKIQSAAGTTSNGISIQSGNASGGASGAMTLQSGTGTTGTGAINILSGNASAGTAGDIVVDTGTSSSGTATVKLGVTNAQAVSIGRVGQTTTVNGLLTVTGVATFNSTITFNGHLITGGSTPTRTVNTAHLGAAATCTISGNDTSGLITIVSDSGTHTAGNECTVTYATAFASAPHVILSAANGNASGMGLYSDSGVNNTTTFDVSFGQTPYSGVNTYTIYYQVLQ